MQRLSRFQKKSRRHTRSLAMKSILAVTITLLVAALAVLSAVSVSASPVIQNQPVVRTVYFYSTDCPHCVAVQEQVLQPLQEKYGSQFDVHQFEISVPANYELLIRAEEKFKVRADQRGIPTLIVGDQLLIGEDAIRAQLPALTERGLESGGIALPNIPGIDSVAPTPVPSNLPICGQTQTSSCSSANPVWVAYFYQVGCQKCSRAESDLAYVKSQRPQLIIDQFNIYDSPALIQWLGTRAGRTDVHTPALFIGGDALIGEEEITPQSIQALADKYAASGAARAWADFDQKGGQGGLVEQFRALGPLTVVLAGLVDGLNPCAFATLIFLISYLTFSGRKGREVIAVGGAFTFGVFMAYLGVGLGLYKVLDLLGSTLTMLSRWVYAATAILCAVLAVYSFLDYLKARRGRLEDMTLKLPAALRKRVNAVVRTGAQARAFVAGAFVTGVFVSLIELACTGQIYLPTIIFVTSIPELRVQGIGYLVLYNLVFILPLVVVFFLAYFGTTSHQLGNFLEKNAARVKLGAVVLFAALATWLGFSLLVQ